MTIYSFVRGASDNSIILKVGLLSFVEYANQINVSSVRLYMIMFNPLPSRRMEFSASYF